ncbi:unnamed protein product [Stenotrophomonas maltophilia]|uniref:hypothetical protein n=1 Tax=Stenotrophomonas maltophilia TaxID=40324 RepID=UPI0006A86059|nr:hypothetical protein [Stenotrophomonas maltophilia]CRX69972.1 unnamed protein product [Stenotrophomonas maltophilia]
MLALFDSLRHWLDGIAHLGTIMAVAYLLYLFALAGWIMLQKREPVATLRSLFGRKRDLTPSGSTRPL